MKKQRQRSVPESKKEGSKLSLDFCKKILNRNGQRYCDKQVTKIRDFLYFLAEAEYEHFKRLTS